MLFAICSARKCKIAYICCVVFAIRIANRCKIAYMYCVHCNSES